MQKANYEVEVLVNGKPIKEYFHNGKNYIEGKKGTEFSLRLKNHSWSRKLFIPTVDGLSVIDGNEGSFESGGYIVPAQSTVTVDGWRVSDKEVAKFFFSAEKEAYSQKKGKGGNIGVIGLAVFDEKINNFFPTFFTTTATSLPMDSTPTTTWKPWKRSTIDPNVIYTETADGTGQQLFSCSSNNNSINAFYCSSSVHSSEKPTQDIGTGWGDYKGSEVTTVEFEKYGQPVMFEIYYNTKEQLEKMGIVFKSPMYLTPQTFPGRYCEPPKE